VSAKGVFDCRTCAAELRWQDGPGAPAIGGGGTGASGGTVTAMSGGAASGNGALSQAGVGGRAGAAGANDTAGANSFAGAEAHGGSAGLGSWVTLNHRDPPHPSDNPFDFEGAPATFTDVWSDGPRSALIAGVTPGYKGPSTAWVAFLDGRSMSNVDTGPGLLYQPPRLAALSVSDFWLAEDSFGLRHSDGATWTVYAEPQARLIWENAANDLWACSSVTSAANLKAYYLVHWDGSVWNQIALPSLDGFVPLGLWSPSPTDAFVAGSGGTLLHWNGTVFAVAKCPGVGVWNAVWGDAAAIWTAGDGGGVARWQGGSCTLLPIPAVLEDVPAFYDIWGNAPDSVWIVGQGGSILHWNGSTLELDPSGQSENLNAVWGHASGVVWAVGNNETVLQRQF